MVRPQQQQQPAQATGNTSLRPTTRATTTCLLLLAVATTSLVAEAFVLPTFPASSSSSSSSSSFSSSSSSSSSKRPAATLPPICIRPSLRASPESIPVLRSMMDMEGGGGGEGGGFSVVNQVMLVGNLGSEPAIKYLDSGNCVLSISLAVNKELPPSAVRGEGGASEVDWIRVEAWGKTAENLAAGARKGSRVWVVGKLVTNSWVDKYGQNRNDLKVRVKRAEVLQTARTQMPAQQQMGGGSYYQQQQWDAPPQQAEDYMGGGQQQQRQQEQKYVIPAGFPHVSAPYTKKSTYGNDGGGGGGGGGQYEVENYDVDVDIPF